MDALQVEMPASPAGVCANWKRTCVKLLSFVGIAVLLIGLGFSLKSSDTQPKSEPEPEQPVLIRIGHVSFAELTVHNSTSKSNNTVILKMSYDIESLSTTFKNVTTTVRLVGEHWTVLVPNQSSQSITLAEGGVTVWRYKVDKIEEISEDTSKLINSVLKNKSRVATMDILVYEIGAAGEIQYQTVCQIDVDLTSKSVQILPCHQ